MRVLLYLLAMPTMVRYINQPHLQLAAYLHSSTTAPSVATVVAVATDTMAHRGHLGASQVLQEKMAALRLI
jgi:hypothetical protein